MLTLLKRAVSPPRLRFTFTDQGPTARLNQPVDVDLVLDIGNSRTCGMLMETSGDDRMVDMNDSYRLTLRDLSRPEQVYDEPFPSRVEFVPAAGLAMKSCRAAVVGPAPSCGRP
jgi:hypothetical protein